MRIQSEKIFVALDTADVSRSMHYLNLFADTKIGLKIGMELFYSAGAEIIYKAKEKGFYIFLDLKLHDIPTTVSQALKVLCNLPIDIINVHAAGGSEMLRLASETVKSSPSKPKLVAVTQLTSTTKLQMNQEQRIQGEMLESVIHYAKISQEAGLDGVVCSPFEVQEIKSVCGDDFLTITPGIRLPSTKQDDQKRTATPLEAMKFGADYLVVGRPITRSLDPVSALDNLLNGRY